MIKPCEDFFEETYRRKAGAAHQSSLSEDRPAASGLSTKKRPLEFISSSRSILVL